MVEHDDRPDRKPRSNSDWKFWFPWLLALSGQLLMVGWMYGQLGGRLDLIDYRLHQIEQKVGIAP